MSDLPKDYDVIIVGTGLTESILAAALSRIGKIVLHIDRNQYYGGEFSSHNLNALIEWEKAVHLKKVAKIPEEPTGPLILSENENFQVHSCNNDMGKYFFDVEYNFDENVKEELLKQSRKFIIDLSPNIFYSNGPLIKLLISSDVARYCEFKLVSQILTRRDNQVIEKVPTSRSDVFRSDQLGFAEKRVMMQFVQSCLKDNNFAELIDEQKANSISFRDFIAEKKLPETIAHYLINAVAMSSDESRTAFEGLVETRKFLKSVGRYGDSPFLYCLYGSGELSQCFCRMGAVFGALYYLTLTIDKFHVNKSTNLIESIDAITEESESFKFNCKHLILDTSYSPTTYFENFDAKNSISRCILITDKSIFKNKSDQNDEHVSLLVLPKTSKSPEIYIFEASHTVNCSPENYFLVYMFCKKSNKTAKEDFEECIKSLFSDKNLDGKVGGEAQEQVEASAKAIDPNDPIDTTPQSTLPNCLFSFFYSHLNSTELVTKNLPTNKPENLHIIGGSSVSLDYDYQIKEAERIFRIICPSEEFLPRPPEPEDIIIESSPTPDFEETEKNSEPKVDDTELQLPEAKEPKLDIPESKEASNL